MSGKLSESARLLYVDKAVCCVVQAGTLLCFAHPLAGNQVPKGTVEVGESVAEAVIRELREESGVVYRGAPAPLGSFQRLVGAGPEEAGPEERHVWHLFLMPVSGLPSAWAHPAVGSAEEEGLVFEYFWHPLHQEPEGFAPPFVEVIARVRSALDEAPLVNRPHQRHGGILTRTKMSTFKVGKHDVPSTPDVSGKVEVRPSPGKGVGLFAIAPIAVGEIVLVWGGRSYTDERGAAKAKAQGRGIMQWDDDLFSCEGVEDHAAFGLNHSCDPNVWMQDTFRLTARRAIPPGEELAMDYAMLGGEEDFRSEWGCLCGAPNCRGVISGEDWKLESLRVRYAGHFIPFVNRKIAAAARSNQN